MQLPHDQRGALAGMITDYIHYVAIDSDAACDVESEVAWYSMLFYPQQCLMKGSWVHLTAASRRYSLEGYHDPDKDFFGKYFGCLPWITAPYLLPFVPLGMLNVFIIYRVAKECPGVWYHVAHAIGDVFALLSGIILYSYAYLLIAPLFAWTSYCQNYSWFLFQSILSDFSKLFSTISLTLLCYDRYLTLCKPEKYLTAEDHTRKYLLLAALVAAAPVIIKSAEIFFIEYYGPYNSSLLSWVHQLFASGYYFVASFYCGICLILIIYWSFKTVKKSKSYQPPAGASNHIQKMELLKRFGHLTKIALILNSVYIVYLFLSSLTNAVNALCTARCSNEGDWCQKDTFCKFYFDNIAPIDGLLAWEAHFTVFTSNIGFIVHCTFLVTYRDEVIKLCRQVLRKLLKKHNPAVAPN